MFSRRRSLPSGHTWDRTILTSFAADLSKGGFHQITIKLPIDLDTILDDELTQEQLITELQAREISIDEFLNRERNYRAVILVAKSKTTNETIKVLFGNISEKTTFSDSTFPSGHSARSTLYVQSPDPARVYPLFDFFYDYLTKQGHSTVGRTILGLLSTIVLAAESITLLGSGKAFVQTMWDTTPAIDIGITVMAVYLMYNFFRTPVGLSVNDRETARLPNYLQRALKGEMRDNPLVNIIVTIIGTVIAALILNALGWPPPPP
jgi:hypothetical protein